MMHTWQCLPFFTSHTVSDSIRSLRLGNSWFRWVESGWFSKGLKEEGVSRNPIRHILLRHIDTRNNICVVLLWMFEEGRCPDDRPSTVSSCVLFVGDVSGEEDPWVGHYNILLSTCPVYQSDQMFRGWCVCFKCLLCLTICMFRSPVCQYHRTDICEIWHI